MRQHYPYELESVTTAQRTRPDPEAAALEAVQRLADPCQNGWFRATSAAALAVFHAVLPDDLDDDFPTTHQADAAMGEDAQPDAPNDQTNDAEALVDPQLWEHVESCSTREAMKALDIRTALVAMLGKSRATELLSKTRATVAKNAQGQNNRVLRANGSLLKLKTR